MAMEEKKILLLGFGGFAGSALAANLQRRMGEIGVLASMIDKRDYKVPLGIATSLVGTGRPIYETAAQIPGLEKLRRYEGEELPCRVLLFVGFDSGELDEALAVCRECGIGRDDLKAVLTPDNALWDAEALCKELAEEHRRMG